MFTLAISALLLEHLQMLHLVDSFLRHGWLNGQRHASSDVLAVGKLQDRRLPKRGLHLAVRLILPHLVESIDATDADWPVFCSSGQRKHVCIMWEIFIGEVSFDSFSDGITLRMLLSGSGRSRIGNADLVRHLVLYRISERVRRLQRQLCLLELCCGQRGEVRGESSRRTSEKSEDLFWKVETRVGAQEAMCIDSIVVWQPEWCNVNEAA